MANVLSQPIKRITWAIDPFETGPTLEPSAFEELDRWTTSGALIEPTYIFTPFEHIKFTRDEVASKISEIVQQSKIKTLQPNVLSELSSSITSRIGTLISNATSSGAGLIAVSSHCRSGLKRMLFGSFAESLLNLSPLPILFLNQHARPENAERRRVLWATDFSKTCEFAFESFLQQSKGFFDEIILFHDLSLILEMNRYSGWEGISINTEELVQEKRRWAAGEASAWMEKVRHNGFDAKSIVESGHNISADILSTAKENQAGTIAMASETSPFASLLFGSHARNVFRTSEYPVWVYGPGFCEMYKAPSQDERKEVNRDL